MAAHTCGDIVLPFAAFVPQCGVVAARVSAANSGEETCSEETCSEETVASPGHEHRAWRVADELFGHAAQQEPWDAGEAMRACDEQIRFHVRG